MDYPAYRRLPPLYSYLIALAEINHDPRCLQRIAHQPGKPAQWVFHSCWVWFRTFEHELEKNGVIQVAKNGERGEFKGFINIRLTDADKEALVAGVGETDTTTLIDNAAALLYEGYKLSFAYDKTSGSVQATLACWQEGHPDCGHAISSRNPDFIMALHSLLHKHFNVARECWTAFAPPAPLSTWD
jgi:hypothetical protein